MPGEAFGQPLRGCGIFDLPEDQRVVAGHSMTGGGDVGLGSPSLLVLALTKEKLAPRCGQLRAVRSCWRADQIFDDSDESRGGVDRVLRFVCRDARGRVGIVVGDRFEFVGCGKEFDEVSSDARLVFG